MIYKIRLILDSEADVIRDIAINFNNSLEDLHNAITNAFGFDGTEMASFYLCDNDWNQGQEIPLFDMAENDKTVSMQHFLIKDVLAEDNNKLIYVYDYFSMWSFFTELISVSDDSNQLELPSLLFSIGNLPDKAPVKEFKSEDMSDSQDDYNSLENFDDFDFDNFDELIN
jgi:hypothetical protein